MNMKKIGVLEGGREKKEAQNMQAYEELKKRLLTEYKKLTTNKKSFDD